MTERGGCTSLAVLGISFPYHWLTIPCRIESINILLILYKRFVSCFIPFFNLKKLIDSYKAFYEDVQKRVIDCLEPNPNARKLAWASAAVNKIQGNTNNENYPHAERFLSDCFLEYGKQLSQQPGLSKFLCFGNVVFANIYVVSQLLCQRIVFHATLILFVILLVICKSG